ncbi:MlaC/ttg2D family ABC transporter substrate-binding protein [Colwellia sp. 12G3]|uniref:MlaC/ttg2D family ABC transporter substrate-binding protein n=1 Tax=Colwellia sp. 12G3 TaxID=2058299 RepID=UPI000C344FA1|nr:ABC transporter substrate-binding protein [Colwellia sp. 12G3]PKI14828.1 toluene tolerance protein [Colwellia sp. 12G3]
MRALVTKTVLVLVLISTLPAEVLAASSVATVPTNSALSSSDYSESVSPYVVLKTAGTNLFSRISTNQQAIAKFPHLMRDIVEEELMPSIDYRYASYRILGKHLKTISKEQRAEFVKAMRHYLVRTYSIALSKYKNQEVVFEAEKPINGKRIIGIKTQIIEQGAPTINIVFQMRQDKKTKQWKAFDITVEGISLLSTKQAELNKKIAQQGIDLVTLELAALAK